MVIQLVVAYLSVTIAIKLYFRHIAIWSLPITGFPIFYHFTQPSLKIPFAI